MFVPAATIRMSHLMALPVKGFFAGSGRYGDFSLKDRSSTTAIQRVPKRTWTSTAGASGLVCATRTSDQLPPMALRSRRTLSWSGAPSPVSEPMAATVTGRTPTWTVAERAAASCAVDGATLTSTR